MKVQRRVGTLESLSRCRGVDEILVVNDGSTDETGEALEKWRPLFNIRIVEHEERLGTLRSFNEAIRSNCEIVFFTADDHVYPDTDLFVEMRRHFSREEVGIVGCRMVKDGKNSFRLPSNRMIYKAFEVEAALLSGAPHTQELVLPSIPKTFLRACLDGFKLEKLWFMFSDLSQNINYFGSSLTIVHWIESDQQTCSFIRVLHHDIHFLL